MPGGPSTNTSDEVLVRDKDGVWRVWRNGQWMPASAPGTSVAAVAETPSTPTARMTGVEPVEVGWPDPVDELVQQIVQELHLSLASPELRPRLENAIRLRLKDVRDTVDTREVLVKPQSEGGLGFTEELSDTVIQAILNVAPQMHQPAISRRSGELLESAAPTTPAPAAPQPSMPNATPSVVPAVPLNAPVAPAPRAATPLIPASQKPFVIASAAKAVQVSGTIAARPASMVDVRTRPAAVGPIDELKLFTLLDFRRLDPDPKRAAARLKEKVKLLEDESYEKMVDGVRAWRQSPLHGLYLSLGEQSLATNQPIARVIESRKATGEATLTPQEFETIMELNKNLRF